MKQTRERHQKGSLRKQKRPGGREVWVYRWREIRADDTRRPRKLVVGSVEEFRTEAAAWREVDAWELNINLDLSENGRKPRSFAELIAHYEAKELNADNLDKSHATKDVYHRYIWGYIRDRWGSYSLQRMENGIAVHVEEWLKTLTRGDGKPMARSSKSKIRNIMSAICSHAIRYGWMKHNPIIAVRQSAKRQIQPEALEPDELQKLIAALGPLERTLIVLDVPTGMRVGELLALQWEDFDLAQKTVTIRKSIWHQHLGPVKTDESARVMPLDTFMVEAVREWHARTPYAAPKDWVFASARKKGRQPLWPCGIMHNHIAKTAAALGITKRIGWHTFRRTFSTLLIGNEEDVKTTQTLMRHSNPNVTLALYAQAIDTRKRRAQSKVVEMIRPAEFPAGLPIQPMGSA